MAVAFDKFTESADFTADTTFDHTPVGTPKGVLVFIGQNGATGDQIDSVTYGGQALTFVAAGEDTNVELMRAEAWFLGSGIPTGTQTVAINETGGTTKRAWCVTVTAAADTEVEGSNTTGQNQDDPSVTITTGASVETYVAAFLMSGLGVVGDVTAGSGYTMIDQSDLGQQTAHLEDIDTNDAGGNVVAGFVTNGTDDVAMVAVAVKEAGGGDHPVDAQPGSFSFTGVLATLAAARLFQADPGTFTLTGVAATLARGLFASADPGSYAVAGSDATLLADRVLSADPGSFAVTGTDATLASGKVLSADPGTFAVTGTDASLVAGYSLSADPAAFTVTGVAAELVHTTVGAYTLDAAPGTFTVTGTDASLSSGRVVQATAGAFAVTGADADLVHTTVGAYTINVEPGSFTVTGTAATVVATRELSADPGIFAITGTASTLSLERTLLADPAAYAATGTAATLLADRTLNAATGTFTVTGAAAGLGQLFDSEIDAQPGVFTVTGNAATLTFAPGLARGTTRGGRIRWNTTGGFRGENRAGRITQTYEGAVS